MAESTKSPTNPRRDNLGHDHVVDNPLNAHKKIKECIENKKGNQVQTITQKEACQRH